MTYKQYWQMDCELVRAYRKAYELRQEQENALAWLQGYYIYAAIDAQRPGFVFYGRKPPKAEKYLEKPTPVTKAMKDRYEDERVREMAEKLRASLSKRNKKIEEGGVADAGGTGNTENTNQV